MTAPTATRWTYAFDEGSRELRDLLGGKGANIAEMTRAARPRPRACRVHDHHGGVRGVHAGRPPCSGRSRAGHRRCARAPGGRRRPAPRRSRRPAAGLRAQRRPRLDARDDGHRPEPRAQRRVRRGPRPDHRQRALRLGLLPPAGADVRGRRARHPRQPVRGGDRPTQGGARRAAGHGPRHRRAARADAPLPGALRLPLRAAHAALRGRARGIRLLDGRPCGRLPPAARDPRRLGHRRQRPADGVRQPRAAVRARASPSRATR